MYRNPPSNNPWAGVWTDGTALNYLNYIYSQPDNFQMYEVCVNIFVSWTTNCGMSGTYAARRGTWSDIVSNSVCDYYAVVCKLQCTTAQFPIDGCKLM